MHINAGHCIFLYICAYFHDISAYFNLHVMVYLSLCIFQHIMHIYAYKHIFTHISKMHIDAYLILHIYTYFVYFSAYGIF